MALPLTINDLLVKSSNEEVDLGFFNRRYTAIMSGLTNLDSRMTVYDAQVTDLVQLGLDRLNTAMGPMLVTLGEAANLGFLVCQSVGVSHSLTAGAAVGWNITSGANIFTPTAYLLAQDANDSTNWGILSVDSGGWVQSAATLATHVVFTNKTATSTSWSISCNSAFQPAMASQLSAAQTAATNAANSASSAAANAATVAGFVAAINAGPVASVAGKTGVVTLVEGDIANLVADLAARPTSTSVNTSIAGKQNSSAKLTAIDAMTWAANQILMATGTGTISTTAATALGLALLSAANSGGALTSLGLSSFFQTLISLTSASAVLNALAGAPLASPAFTGTPLAPTPATADNDTSVATTAFVRAAISAYSPSAAAPTIATIADAASTTFDAGSGSTFLARLAATANRTLVAPTGSPTDGQRVIIEHTASGGARTLSLTTGSAGAFRFGTDITSPLTATTSGKIDRISVIYNAAATRWDVVGYVRGF